MGAIRLEIPSDRQMVDLAEVVAVQVARIHRMADGEIDNFGLAVRESVTNAIIHGNREDSKRSVSIEFAPTPRGGGRRLVITVCDEGHGFDPEEVADPLAPENILKPSGRGLLFMRAFTDDLSVTRRSAGGTEVRFVKPLGRPGAGGHDRPSGHAPTGLRLR